MFNTTNAPKGGEERVVSLFHIRQENHQHSEKCSTTNICTIGLEVQIPRSSDEYKTVITYG